MYIILPQPPPKEGETARKCGGEKLSPFDRLKGRQKTFYILYLSMLRYWFMVDSCQLTDSSSVNKLSKATNNLKVVIAAGLTSSHPEQSS
jgi:hypothetical protein